MVADARVTIDDARLKKALLDLQAGIPGHKDATPAMQAIGRVLKTSAQLRFREGRGPDGTAWQQSFRAQLEGGQTLSLTRRLRNSISYKADQTSTEVGTNVAYAAIHQFGGVIRAKSGPFLAIPITQQARRAGSPRNMKHLVVAQSLKGQFMLLDHRSGTVHYLLRKQVRMPARPFLGVSDDDRTELLRVMSAHLQRTWGGR